jgi:hypothetical protein
MPPAQQAQQPSADTAVLSFDKGLDRSSPRTKIKSAGYDDAQNIVLLGAQSSKHPTSVGIDAVLDPQVSWPSGNPIWTAPFSYSTYDAGAKTLTLSTHLVVARDTGQYHRYDAGSPGTVTSVRRGFLGTNLQINDFVYDKWLLTLDGRNPVMKYGQHFLWSGQNENTPYLFPLGSRPITPLMGTTQGETWVQTGSNAFVSDPTVPQGARVSTAALNLMPGAGNNSRLQFTPGGTPTSLDLTLGPQPYGGRVFAATDSLVVSFIGNSATATTGNARIRFLDSTLAKYFEFTITLGGIDNTTWHTYTMLRSAATSVGAPNWNAIQYVQFFNDDAARDIFVDDLYLLYSDAPPPAQVGVSHKDRIVLGGAPIIGTTPSLGTVIYSNAQNPDNFANAGTNNTQNISGGFESLAKVNQITSLREYQDSVIIGTPSAIFAWTVGSSGTPAKSTISTEHGIDSHRGVIETPNGSLIFPWQHGYYILRATGRQFVGAKIQPFIANMATDDSSWTMTVLDEATKTIRTWFREGLSATHVTSGLVFDYVLAQETAEAVWPSKMTQMADWAVPVYINGSRVIILTKFNDPQLYVLGGSMTGSLTSYITLPWMGEGDDTMATKWMGVDLSYASAVPVDVYVRYASNPQEFDSAAFTLRRTLPASPTATEQGRVLFGGTTRWAQVKIQATTLAAGGFELFPPARLIPLPTSRPGG